MQQKDRPFPKYAKDYFNQLREQYLLLLEAPCSSPRTIPRSTQRLLEKADTKPDDLSWGDVFALETAYLYAVPAERLPDELLLARDRYRDIVGTDAYATYAKTVPPGTSAVQRTPDELRSELMAIAERIRYTYTFEPPKEFARNRLSMRAGWYTLAAALVGLAVYVWAHSQQSTVATIVVVLFVGQMGGFLSVQQRLQSAGGDDPLFKELQLTNGWFSVAIIAPISGSVFAIVLYFLFVGGLMSGGLFPHFGPSTVPAPTATTSPIDVTQFLEHANPTALQDWGKLLAWAFVAGFAERFVPDTLSRMTGQASRGDGSPKAPTSSLATPMRAKKDDDYAEGDDRGGERATRAAPVP